MFNTVCLSYVVRDSPGKQYVPQCITIGEVNANLNAAQDPPRRHLPWSGALAHLVPQVLEVVLLSVLLLSRYRCLAPPGSPSVGPRISLTQASAHCGPSLTCPPRSWGTSCVLLRVDLEARAASFSSVLSWRGVPSALFGSSQHRSSPLWVFLVGFPLSESAPAGEKSGEQGPG